MEQAIQRIKLTTLVPLLVSLGLISPIIAIHSASAASCPQYSSTVEQSDGSKVCVCTDGNPPSGGQCDSGECATLNSCGLISKYIDPFVEFLAAAVGVGVVTSIIIGGIQYSSSAGDPGKVSAAKNRIRNAIIALITFMLLYGLIDFLIPGGLARF
jgi:hypothetical protein